MCCWRKRSLLEKHKQTAQYSSLCISSILFLGFKCWCGKEKQCLILSASILDNQQGHRFLIKGQFKAQGCNLKVRSQSLLRGRLQLFCRLQSIGSHSLSPACPRIERPLRAKCKCYSGERRGPQMKRYSAEGVEDWPSVSVPPTDTQQSSLWPFSRADEGGGEGVAEEGFC